MSIGAGRAIVWSAAAALYLSVGAPTPARPSTPAESLKVSDRFLEQIVRPRWGGRCSRHKPFREALAGKVRAVRVDQVFNGWPTREAAQRDLAALLDTASVDVRELPCWSMIHYVSLIGTIEYADGTRRKIVVADYAVGFQGRDGRSWYFEWGERIPWKER